MPTTSVTKPPPRNLSYNLLDFFICITVKQVKLPDIKPRAELPKIGRNENVVIEKNGERVEMKFKKAEPLILNEGWRLVKW